MLCCAVLCCAVLCRAYLTFLLTCIVCDTPSARLESRTSRVELLEDLGSLLKSQRRVSENSNLVFHGGIRGDAHVLHRVEAARPVGLDLFLVVHVDADDSDFAVLDNTSSHGVDEALAPHAVSGCGASVVRIVDNQELEEDEWLGFHEAFDFRFGRPVQHFLNDFIVKESEPDDIAIVIYGIPRAAAILEDVLLDELVRVDAAGLEECQDLCGSGFIPEVDALDVGVGGGGGGNGRFWR